MGDVHLHYVGGAKASPGFSFWGNFWCDLLHAPALNGAPNERGALLVPRGFEVSASFLERVKNFSSQILAAHVKVRVPPPPPAPA